MGGAVMDLGKLIAMAENCAFWQVDDQVYRVPKSAALDVHGRPMGMRWECSVAHWARYRDTVFSWAKDVEGGAGWQN